MIATSAFAGGSGGPTWSWQVYASSVDQWFDYTADNEDLEFNEADNTWSYSSDPIMNETFTINTFSCVMRDGINGNYGFTGGVSSFVDTNMVVTNNTNAPQTFSIMMSLDVADIVGASFMSGAVAATITNNDPFGGDATLNNAPDGFGGEIPIYDGLIDALSARTMWDSGYSLVAVGGAASNADSDDFNRELGPGVDTIGVMLTIQISAFDSATISGLFGVSEVPAPGALAVLAMAGLVGSRRRRG